MIKDVKTKPRAASKVPKTNKKTIGDAKQTEEFEDELRQLLSEPVPSTKPLDIQAYNTKYIHKWGIRIVRIPIPLIIRRKYKVVEE